MDINVMIGEAKDGLAKFKAEAQETLDGLRAKIKDADGAVDQLQAKAKQGSDSLDAKYDKVTGKYSYVVPIITFVVGTVLGAAIANAS